MEDETNNELLINTEPQATEQPTNQQTQQPTPEQNQETTETPKQEEQKMSEVDLSKMSLEDLQAEIERRKQEEASKKNYANLGIDFNNPKQGDLVKWVYGHANLELLCAINGNVDKRIAADFPGNIALFCTLLDDYSGNVVKEQEKVKCIRIWDVDIENKQVVDINVLDSDEPNVFRILMIKIFNKK